MHLWGSSSLGWAQLVDSAHLGGLSSPPPPPSPPPPFLPPLFFFFFLKKSIRIYPSVSWHAIVVYQCLRCFERQCSIIVKGSGTRLPAFKFQLSHFPATHSGGSYFLSLSFLLCEISIIIPLIL